MTSVMSGGRATRIGRAKRQAMSASPDQQPLASGAGDVAARARRRERFLRALARIPGTTAGLGHRREEQHRVIAPLAAEEEALTRLYGTRTGTVSSWTTRPPVELL
jgi:hypothetical protein